MAGPLNKLPWGLLGFLQLKNQGQYPNQLVESIQPEWDIERLITIHDERSAFDVTTTLGVGALNFVPMTIVVPASELWLVRQVTGFLQTDAAETVTAALAHVDSFNFVNIDSGSVSLVASTQRHIATSFGSIYGEAGCLYGPGTILGWMVDQCTTAANIVAQQQVRFIRFPL